MAFQAKLKLSGKEYDVISCDFSFHRDVDPKGRPASRVYGGAINIVVESTADSAILDSMVNNEFKPLDGTVTFKKSDEDSKMKELSFSKGYIVQYSEGIDAVGSNPMLIHFTVSAETIKIGGSEHKNDWPV